MLRFLENLWIRTKIAFDVKDPLQTTKKAFELPEDFQELDPIAKRKLTICNLFANHSQSVEQIAEYYHVPKNQVVTILIEEGFIKDQRLNQQQTRADGRRRTDKPLTPADSGAIDTSSSQ